jgi:hypothetical protein
MKYYKNIIAGGCSFTACDLGGLPPTDISEGVNYYSIGTDKIPWSWTSIVARELNPQSYVNLASGGAGNLQITNTIVDLFNNYNYNVNDTLILFNLSAPTRFDLICDWYHPDKSDYTNWDKSVLPYTFLGPEKPVAQKIKKELDIDNIEKLTVNLSEMFLAWLDSKKIDYIFGLMSSLSYERNEILQQKVLNNIIGPRKEKLLSFGDILYMRDYAASINQTFNDKMHPNLVCHKIFADLTLKKIEELY